MRKAINGLVAIIEGEMGSDPFSADLSNEDWRWLGRTRSRLCARAEANVDCQLVNTDLA
jgi:hypothetical protein